MGAVPIAFIIIGIFSRPIWPFVLVILLYYAMMILFHSQDRILYDRNGIIVGAGRGEKTIYWSQIVSVEDRFETLRRNPSPQRVFVITYRNSGGRMESIKMDGQDYTWKNLVVDAACGAITGAAAASGIPVAGQAIVGAVVGFGGSVASDVLNGETEIDVTKALNYAASGALGGLMGGNGIRFGNSMQFGNILTGKLTSEIVPAVIKTGLVFAGASFAGSFLNHSYDNMNGQRGRIYFDLEEGRFTW